MLISKNVKQQDNLSLYLSNIFSKMWMNANLKIFFEDCVLYTLNTEYLITP